MLILQGVKNSVMKIRLLLTALLVLMLPAAAAAQEKLTPEQEEKELYERIQEQVDKMSITYKLEDWQIFYLDSILVHNYNAMTEEFKALQDRKVSNSDYYLAVQDKWAEATYQAIGKVFNPVQWKQYLKYGADRDKKIRDKRQSKRQ